MSADCLQILSHALEGKNPPFRRGVAIYLHKPSLVPVKA